MYLGSWKIDDNLTFTCNTHAPSTGAATDADSVPDYRVYEDETGTAILTGSLAKLDDANTTGFYSEQITLSAANGLEKGKTYTIYISAAVGGVTGTMSHTFQIEAEVDANTVSGSISTVGAVSGAVGSVTGNVGGNVTGSVGSVVGNVGGNVVGSVASVVGAVGSVTGAVGSVTGAVGSVTGNVGGNVTGSVGSLGTQAKADVNAECDTAISDYDPPTRAELTTDKTSIITEIDANETKIDLLATAADLATVSTAVVTTIPALIGTPSADLATDIASIQSDTTAIVADTGTDGVVLTAAAVDSILDEVIEGTTTLRQALRIFMAALAGQSTGGGTATLTFRDIADSKARITATVDADGNRTAITLDGS